MPQMIDDLQATAERERRKDKEDSFHFPSLRGALRQKRLAVDALRVPWNVEHFFFPLFRHRGGSSLPASLTNLTASLLEGRKDPAVPAPRQFLGELVAEITLRRHYEHRTQQHPPKPEQRLASA
jgi:hypothetical protein